MARSRPDGEYNLASYAYDAFSRLISRSVGVSPTTTTAYFYNGWNRIAEYEINNQNSTIVIRKSFLWGLDLSGAFQGAGGVGGLLSVNTIGGSVHYPTFDGNGNITEYLTAAGAVAAHFEYDPFGNVVASTDATNQFEYRFSTKPQDSATGLLYYGYRWYDPLTGRWPSRDPIGEKGGLNLYGFVGNDGVDWVDLLGFAAVGTINGDGKLEMDGLVEDEEWDKMKKFAEDALKYWIEFLDMRQGKDDAKLTDKCKEKMLCVIRAMSWSESRHGGASEGAQPGRDPMQVGDPRNSFWKQLTDKDLRNSGRIVGNRSKTRPGVWIDDIPSIVKDQEIHLPINGGTSTWILPRVDGVLPTDLTKPTRGHENTEFTPKMSYFWGVFYWLKRTGGNKPWTCGNCDWKYLIDGAEAYNSAPKVRHREKIVGFLEKTKCGGYPKE